MGSVLVRICEPTFLKDIIANKKELSLNKLINMSRAEYKFSLTQIVKTIQKRTEEIEKRLAQI